MYDAFICMVFKWAQNRLKPSTDSIFTSSDMYDCMPLGDIELAGYTLEEQYAKFELSQVTHNKGKQDQYSCLLVVAREPY